MHKIVNGKKIEMTSKEVSALKKDRQNVNAEFKPFNDALIKKVANQKTGNQKLLDLGLTQDEATALTGYAPPKPEEEGE